MSENAIRNVLDFGSRVTEGSISAGGQLALFITGAFFALGGLTLLIMPLFAESLDLGREYLFVSVLLLLFGLISVITGALLRREEAVPLPESVEDIAVAVQQLQQNYASLRSRTNFAFYAAIVFIAFGLGVIIFGAVQLLTDQIPNIEPVTGIATLISEFIGGMALVVYRSTFTKLNQTSQRLEESWRILMAYRLADSLPEARRAGAVLQLVYVLAGIEPESIDQLAVKEARLAVAIYGEEE